MSSRLVQATRRLHSKAGQYRKTAWEVGSRQRTSRALLFTILVFLAPTSPFSSESVRWRSCPQVPLFLAPMSLTPPCWDQNDFSISSEEQGTAGWL